MLRTLPRGMSASAIPDSKCWFGCISSEVLESASTGQILLQYGGRKISMSEADRLVQEVHWLEVWRFFSRFRPVLIQWFSSPQGHESHLKSNITCAFCFDSRCLPRQGYSIDWYVRNHLVAGFANSNPRRLCNARFKVVDNEIFLVAIKPIKKNEEIFVHYKIHRRTIAR